MKKSKPTDKRKPVVKIVHEILDMAKAGRADGPSSGLYSRDAQMSSALTRAGTFLASLDHAAPAKKAHPLHNLLGALNPPKPKKRRSWFFAAKDSPMPDAKRIEQLLKSVSKDSTRLVLEAHLPEAPAEVNRDINCVLPEGAADPVCEPR